MKLTFLSRAASTALSTVTVLTTVTALAEIVPPGWRWPVRKALLCRCFVFVAGTPTQQPEIAGIGSQPLRVLHRHPAATAHAVVNRKRYTQSNPWTRAATTSTTSMPTLRWMN